MSFTQQTYFKICPQCKHNAPLDAVDCPTCRWHFPTEYASAPPPPAHDRATAYRKAPPLPPQYQQPPQYSQPQPQQQQQPYQNYPQQSQQGYQTPLYAAPPYADSIQVPPGTHSVTTAIILAILIPGAGQMANKQTTKGIVLFLAGFVLPFGLWIVALIDAIQIANRLHRGEAVGRWQWF